ncbi:Mitochondrial Carrier (MC) Family [Achlya hypogyna]|uniref:Mitochondrial Carrier (MC) Family n=1 Tax=Achlya hypogyna TaxID=1202772 RepID=A0A1V9ZGG5_ACHHY|nr:Mitochondrial Carrier (MC) Family [Achlya hypogyna]
MHLETVITHFFSGTVAGVTGAIVGYPLDTIKSRIQTQKHVPGAGTATPLQCLVHSIRTEGFLSLYRGASSQVARSAIGCSFLFGLMAQFKWLFYTPSAGEGSPEKHPKRVLTAAASCTGLVEAMLYTPFEITMIRMQVGQLRLLCLSVLQTQATSKITTLQQARHIFTSYGLRNGLYRGFIPTCYREMIGNTSYFFTYEKTKDILQSQTLVQRQLSDMEVYGYSGAVAGLMYWCISFPLDTVKSVIQADTLDPTKRAYRGFVDCVAKLYQEDGLRRFFRGLSPCLIRAMPVNAVQFISFEKSVDVLMPLWPVHAET